MAKPTRITIAVSGEGQFPIDMLRYDACYPDTATDVVAIERSLLERNTTWEIKISKVNSNPFTVARWESFGCTVRPFPR